MQIQQLDHLVLTVRDIDVTVDFYQKVLGMDKVMFGGNRVALSFGEQKINLHQQGKEFEPKAASPLPGSADLCFISSTPMAQIMEHLKQYAVAIIEGPVRRTGANGPIVSVYIRDPDQNLLELANVLES